MTYVRTQHWQSYLPRTISKSLFRSLVEALDQFKPGLNTASRKIKAKAISYRTITSLEGPQSWKVTDPHPLPELEQLEVELLLVANTTDSCELHIDFRSERIFLSVSDIQTGWGKSVFEEARHLLSTLGISSEGWKATLRKSYAVLEILQYLLLIVSVAMFSVWLQNQKETYLYASLGLFVSGVIPTLRRLVHFFRPPSKTLIIQEAPPKNRHFPGQRLPQFFRS